MNDELIILGDDQDGKIVLIQFVDGKKYKLQHPSVRVYLQWKQDCVDMKTQKLNMVSLLDKCFEHCVFPEGHDYKPSLDNIPPKYAGAWEVLLYRFLEGKLEYNISESERTGANGKTNPQKSK